LKTAKISHTLNNIESYLNNLKNFRAKDDHIYTGTIDIESIKVFFCYTADIRRHSFPADVKNDVDIYIPFCKTCFLSIIVVRITDKMLKKKKNVKKKCKKKKESLIYTV
jgi:hypothetical protein